MRADIHDGPEHMLQSEAGYIDARPLTPARQNLLQRTAGPYIRVKLRRTQYEHMFSALPPTMDVGLARLKTLRRLKGSQPDLRDRHSAPPQVFKSAGPGGRLVMSSALRNDI